MKKIEKHNARKHYVEGQSLYLNQKHSSSVFALYKKKGEERAKVLEKIFIKKPEEKPKEGK